MLLRINKKLAWRHAELFTNPVNCSIIYITTERVKMETTTREYLRKNGITVGQRGRFSAAAKQAIQEALNKGVVFTDTKNNK
jgi:hypothetical protein